MGVTVAWLGAHRGPSGEEGWRLLTELEGAVVVARARTVLTERGLLRLPSGPREVFRKVYSYRGWGAKARGILRTTFGARSRAAREAEALRLLGALGLAPEPVALAERRTLGFLDAAILAVGAVPGGRDLAALEAAPGLAAAAGEAAGRMHAAGLGGLDLAPRNLVAAPEGAGWRVLKVDSGGCGPAPRGGAAQARDLAELLAGLEGRWPAAAMAELREAYARAAGGIPAGLEGSLPAARAGLARRAPRG